jgi:hypothetical protein
VSVCVYGCGEMWVYECVRGCTRESSVLCVCVCVGVYVHGYGCVVCGYVCGCKKHQATGKVLLREAAGMMFPSNEPNQLVGTSIGTHDPVGVERMTEKK